MTVKSVYMMTDLEGVAGVDDWDPRHREDATTAKGVYDRTIRCKGESFWQVFHNLFYGKPDYPVPA